MILDEPCIYTTHCYWVEDIVDLCCKYMFDTTKSRLTISVVPYFSNTSHRQILIEGIWMVNRRELKKSVTYCKIHRDTVKSRFI
jgi:hypothetical protein